MSARAKLLVIAGEVSGDMHAGRLVQALRGRIPDLECFGIGGDALRAAGMEILVESRDMAVMGISEVLRRYFFFRGVFDRMLAVARERKPDAVLLVDYPGFNLRFAARAHAMGLKTIYFICPQVWAWNRARIPRMAEVVDRLIAIFPFEKQVFAGTKLPVDFVGHPLVDEAAAVLAEPPPKLPWPGEPHVALLPGSRRHEIERLLPVMLQAAMHVERFYKNVGFLIPAPDTAIGATIRSMLALSPQRPERCTVVEGRTRQVLRTARAALVASGTATLEAALMNCANVIVYRVSPLTYFFGRMLVRVPHIGIMNIVAGKRICPEFLQDAATPTALATALMHVIDEGPERQLMLTDLAEAVKQLCPAGAIPRAAEIVAAELGG